MPLSTRIAVLAAALALALAGSASAATGDCYSQQGCTEDARAAKDLVASAGVNTHLGYSDTVYWKEWPLVRSRLLELGVSHVRDGTFPAGYPEVIGPTIAARYKDLGAQGIALNLLVGHEQAMTPTTLAQRLDWVTANGIAPHVIGLEGSNESSLPAAELRSMQCDIHGRAKSDPALASALVVGPSQGAPFDDLAWFERIGDLSGCLDRGNLHPYPGQAAPHLRLGLDLSTGMDRGRLTFGSRPYWATESGYATASPDGSHVSENAMGAYVPRMLMEYFRRGIERTQLYELIDLDTQSSAAIDNYGLLRTDGTRKPAFVALRNLLQIVDDAAPAAGRLGFGIVCTSNCRTAGSRQDGPIRHVLLKHSSGAYFLALWSESSVWDRATMTDTPKPAQGLRLYLHKAPAKVEVFSPRVGSAPLSTDTSGRTTVATEATDELRLVKITPRKSSSVAGAAAPVEGGAPTRAAAADEPAQSCRRPQTVRRIVLGKRTYRAIRAHHARALRKGWPKTLVVNRAGAAQRSDRLLRRVRPLRGRAAYQYPAAIGRTGWRAHVGYVPARERRAHDAALRDKLEPYCDGTRFRYVFR